MMKMLKRAVGLDNETKLAAEDPGDVAMVAGKLAAARESLAKAQAHRASVNDSLMADIATMEAEPFTTRRAELDQAMQAERDAAELVKMLDRAASEAERRAATVLMQNLRAENAELEAEMVAALSTYQAAAREAWTAAQRIWRARDRANDIADQANDLVRAGKVEGGGFRRLEAPDLLFLRLPLAGESGAELACEEGLAEGADWATRRTVGAASAAHFAGVRRGLRVAG